MWGEAPLECGGLPPLLRGKPLRKSVVHRELYFGKVAQSLLTVLLGLLFSFVLWPVLGFV